MASTPSLSSPSSITAFALSAATTLLWAGSVMPSGPLEGPADVEAATPMVREAWLLVPALVLLIVAPVGVVLSSGRMGQRAVLAATDAFVALYAGGALLHHGTVTHLLPTLLVCVLLLVGAMSLIETVRLMIRSDDSRLPTWLRGARLALCLLVLLLPARSFVASEQEASSLIGPFILVALSAGGALVARTVAGLRVAAALVHVGLACLAWLTLRFTLQDGWPPYERISTIGRATMGLAMGVVALAVLLFLLRIFELRATRRATMAREADPAPARDANGDPLADPS